MRKTMLTTALAAVLFGKFSAEKKAATAKPEEQKLDTLAPRCMGMDCFCGGDCPDMKKENNNG